jgi:hypothetical protein
VNPAPLAATADPESSHIAAPNLIASGKLDSQKGGLLAWLRSPAEPLTSAEISAASGLDRQLVARRLPDLAREEIVERRPMRACRATGSEAITRQAAGGSARVDRAGGAA